jgi:hypothetical protein
MWEPRIRSSPGVSTPEVACVLRTPWRGSRRACRCRSVEPDAQLIHMKAHAGDDDSGCAAPGAVGRFVNCRAMAPPTRLGDHDVGASGTGSASVSIGGGLWMSATGPSQSSAPGHLTGQRQLVATGFRPACRDLLVRQGEPDAGARPVPVECPSASVTVGALHLRALGPLRLPVSRSALRPVREHVRHDVPARRGRPDALGLSGLHARCGYAPLPRL